MSDRQPHSTPDTPRSVAADRLGRFAAVAALTMVGGAGAWVVTGDIGWAWVSVVSGIAAVVLIERRDAALSSIRDVPPHRDTARPGRPASCPEQGRAAHPQQESEQ